jgi:hypothetical protein
MKTPGRRSGNLYIPGTVLVAVYQLEADNTNGGVAASWLATIQKSGRASRIRPLYTVEAHMHRGIVSKTFLPCSSVASLFFYVHLA